jgi:catechol 2,3-dioxygenase-like lactoylglutathione lyase family enzyme
MSTSTDFRGSIDPMSTAFIRAIPRLAARDVNRAVEFYETQLGFSASLHLEDYAILRRDAAEIHVGKLEFDPKMNHIMCRVDVRGIADLYERCRALGLVQANDTLSTKPWGRLEFSVVDLDGNVVTFAEAPAAAPAA